MRKTPYHMSHRAHGFVNVSNEGDNLTSAHPNTGGDGLSYGAKHSGSYNTIILLYHCSVISYIFFYYVL